MFTGEDVSVAARSKNENLRRASVHIDIPNLINVCCVKAHPGLHSALIQIFEHKVNRCESAPNPCCCRCRSLRPTRYKEENEVLACCCKKAPVLPTTRPRKQTMQCPETPQAEIHDSLPTPRTTAHGVGSNPGTTRRSSILRRPLSELSNFNFDFSLDINGSAQCKFDTLPESSSPSWKASAHQSSAGATKCLGQQMSLESVFLEAEPRSRPQSSAAALQFHGAARKLRLAQIPSITDHESNIDADSARLWLQASATFSPERIPKRSSRSYSTPRHSRMSNTPQERDITSARRSRLYVLGENDAGVHSPPAKREDNVFGSPTFKVRPQATGTEFTARNIARRHNFSRHTRPPRLYTIRDPNIPHALHGMPTVAATNRASVHSKDHTPLSLARDSAQTLTEPTKSLHKEANQQHIPTTTADMPLETPQQPLRQDYLDGRDGVPTSLGPTQKSGRLPTESRLDGSGQLRSIDLPGHVRESFDSAVTDSLGDGRAQLKRWEIWSVRLFFTLFVFSVNIALGLTYLRSYKHPYLLAILVFMKSKDILSTLADILGTVRTSVHNKIWPPKQPRPKRILSLVCAYAETEEQIRKTVLSLVRGSLRPHKQAVCVILDGKPIDLLSKIFVIQTTITLPYTTWKRERGELNIHAGIIEGTAVILIEKKKNAGKKDSLILGHDLFNYPREDMPHSTKLLRQELWKTIIPSVVSNERLTAFDYIFCTDADSTIHDQALRKLADALCRENNAIAACGVLFAEFGKAKTEYSMWHLFQQFQYTFGQYVRRQAESMWGRVTW